MVENLQDNRTSTALRQLAKKIDDGEVGEFVYLELSEDGSVVSAFSAAERPYQLLGAMEVIKRDIMVREID